jgi:hypothetical protein
MTFMADPPVEPRSRVAPLIAGGRSEFVGGAAEPEASRVYGSEAPEPSAIVLGDADRRSDCRRGCVVAVADVCHSTNGRFDRERFYRAAGLD